MGLDTDVDEPGRQVTSKKHRQGPLQGVKKPKEALDDVVDPILRESNTDELVHLLLGLKEARNGVFADIEF